jgi:DNA-binding CsgD family transcriptional regulator
VLVGRTAEWAAIEAQLSKAGESDGGVVVLRGEAGVGKSVLLDRAAAVPGFRVLSATGVEAESEFPYATAHQLLLPLLPLVDRLPAAQAAAVGVALGTGPGDPPDRFLVALGFLSLVSEAARDQPLLLVVDDLQWCDRASVDALFFVGRRLAAEPVALLLAVRDEPAAGTDLPGVLAGAPRFPELVVKGLDPGEVASLVESTVGVRPPDAVAVPLTGMTRGNPLAVLEVARLLGNDALSGVRPLPTVLPLGDRLEQAFLDRGSHLDAPARDLLLMAAADPVAEIDLLVGAAGLADPVATVAELERTGLVAVRGDRLVFTHPLGRSAVLSTAPTDRRVEAHRRLIDALVARGEHDRAVWHRASAALGTDEGVAAALDDLARRSRQRSGYGAASAAHERAAELSPAVGDRTRRLTDAADDAWLAGQPRRSEALVERAGRTASAPWEEARLLELAARASSRRGDVRQAHRQLLTAAGLIREEHPDTALELCAEAVEGAAFAGDVERLAEATAAASGLDLRQTPRQELITAWLRVNSATLRGEVLRDAELTRRVRELGAQLPDPRLVVWAGITSLNLGDPVGMLTCYQRALDVARDTGAAGSLPYVVEHSALGQAIAGSYAAARSAAEEGLRLAEETEQLRSASHLHAVLAFVAGSTGDEPSCLAHADAAREIAQPLGLGLPISTATWATARLELATARYDAAVDRLLQLNASRPDVGHPVVALWSTTDLVEAAVRGGREGEVGAAVDRLEEVARLRDEAYAAALVGWCRGLLGGADRVPELLVAADTFRDAGIPLADARIRLFVGEQLRRTRQPRQAREHLRTATEAFQRLGAERWADRAAAELRASGEAVPSQRSGVLDALTPQELQIVRYVARGASNREVAAQLFISPRTVEYHLYKAYPKLGVTSRTQLVALLQAEPALA